jgi:putative Mg2+ transporter-C (MgtC) family protein
MNSIYIDDLQKIGISFLVGAIIGIEREYRSKPAGFRTMIMICVGSCLFTILSKEASAISPDRIASTIVTGIGFIGAGVIFKEGLSINGLTTSALIWTTAALGMACGYGNYMMAGVVTLLVLFTMFILESLQAVIDRFHKVTVYKIKFLQEEYSLEDIEKIFIGVAVGHHLLNIGKEKNLITVTYKITSNAEKFKLLNKLLADNINISGFTV